MSDEMLDYNVDTRTKGMRAEIRLAEKLGIPIKADQKEKERTSPCRKRGRDR